MQRNVLAKNFLRLQQRMTDKRGALKLENSQKESHCSPPLDAHGLCLPNPSRVGLIGGVSSGKTGVCLNMIARCHLWKPFKHIYLMSPNNAETSKGEYSTLDVTCLDSFPLLDYFTKRPGRSALIIDDLGWSLSQKGQPSQAELADRICGHVSSHHDGGLSIFIAQQTLTGIPPNIRRLLSHWAIFPQRIARDTVGHIARNAMLEKQTLSKCFDFCTEDFDWLLVSNIQDGRARVRKNGWQAVRGLL